MLGHKISGTSIQVMWGELRGEIFACLRVSGRTLMQMEQGTVTGEGKV